MSFIGSMIIVRRCFSARMLEKLIYWKWMPWKSVRAIDQSNKIGMHSRKSSKILKILMFRGPMLTICRCHFGSSPIWNRLMHHITTYAVYQYLPQPLDMPIFHTITSASFTFHHRSECQSDRWIFHIITFQASAEHTNISASCRNWIWVTTKSQRSQVICWSIVPSWKS